MNMGAEYVKDSTGGYWVKLHVILDLAEFTFAVPLDNMPAFAEKFGELCRTVSRDARRAESGLIVVGQN